MAKRILVADDSVTIQKAFAMTFGAEDVSLVAARSADEGLSMARQNRPDLIIADAGMPGRSGYELCAAVKSDGGLRATPVFILASSQQPFDEAKARQVGADGHLIKPFETTALIEKIREALAKVAGAAAEAPRPTATARPVVPARPSSAAMPAVSDEDYGEISVDAPAARETRPVAPSPAFPLQPARAPGPAAVPAAASAAPASGPVSAPAAPMSPGMRPSLIPGVRPGAVAPARPGAPPVVAPARPMGPGAAPPAQRPAPPMARTLMGLPAANAPLPGSMRPAPGPSPYPGAMPQPRQSPPLMNRPQPQAPGTGAGPLPSPTSTLVGSAVDQKMAAIAARGPEYEAIAKLSREIIEQVVWEIVPELAEAIIREHVEKRGRV
ncbi:MAG TPA: response regulator [Polyangia bacterium]|nr:response regulator [Polyangia bacterium]